MTLIKVVELNNDECIHFSWARAGNELEKSEVSLEARYESDRGNSSHPLAPICLDRCVEVLEAPTTY